MARIPLQTLLPLLLLGACFAQGSLDPVGDDDDGALNDDDDADDDDADDDDGADDDGADDDDADDDDADDDDDDDGSPWRGAYAGHAGLWTDGWGGEYEFCPGQVEFTIDGTGALAGAGECEFAVSGGGEGRIVALTLQAQVDDDGWGEGTITHQLPGGDGGGPDPVVSDLFAEVWDDGFYLDWEGVWPAPWGDFDFWGEAFPE